MNKLLMGHSFNVMMYNPNTFEPFFTCGFKSVKGVKITSTYEPLMVGGKNNGPVLLPLPNKEPGRLTLEHGKTLKDRIFWFNMRHTLDAEVKVMVFDENMQEAAMYFIKNAVIESIELGDLNALASEVLIESVTILYSSIQEII